jgi:hypothetical protein
MQIMRSVRWLLLALVMLAIPAASFAGVVISVRIAPPALPVYTQPPCPGDGYIWTPGYWAYGADGYYWVPGTWVVAPQPGLLWTPGYWGWESGAYLWHAGYWGPHVGFYGGVNYGFGYGGVGFVGGEWRSGHFFYNRSVTNVRITNVHVYNKVVVRREVTRVSFNGGPGGLHARPTHFEEVAIHEHHFQPTHVQIDHEHGARGNREFLASVNHGRPSMGATARPGEFHGHGGPARVEHAPRPAENRHMEAHAMNRPVPHPEPSRNIGRQNNNGRPENHGGPAPHPTSYHPANAPHQNSPHAEHMNAPHAQHVTAPQHENAAHGQHESKGHGHGH